MKPERKIEKARSNLLMTQPFFGGLACRLAEVADPTCYSFWTDGKTLGYNPEWVDKLSLSKVESSFAEAILHIMFGHPWRREGRSPRKWDIATDLAILPILKDAGFEIVDSVRYQMKFHGKSAEHIYPQIPDEPLPPEPPEEDEQEKDQEGEEGQDEESGGKPKTGPCEVRDASNEDAKTSKLEWELAVAEAATLASQYGTLPKGISILVEEIKNKDFSDWRAHTRRWMQDLARENYSWRRPDRRYAGLGYYFPTLQSEGMPPIIVVIDCSGSTGPVLPTFGVEFNSIVAELRPERVYAIYFDTKIHRVDVFEQGDRITFEPVGGGGTDFKPVFSYVEAEITEPIAGMIFLTDLEGSFPAEPQWPSYPVLWAASKHQTYDAYIPRFGEVVEIKKEERNV